jgi:uncharacterized protein
MALPVTFEWDAANRNKNKRKHKVEWFECEEIFTNTPLLVLPNPGHSIEETRHYAYGSTNFGRHLFISFTIRNQKIRVISARQQSRQERNLYEKLS